MNAPQVPATINVNIPSLQMAEDELIRVLESSIYPGARLASIKLAIGYCKSNALDPMTKPVHIVPMNVKKAGTRDDYEWRDVIMPGIELYRTKAARTGEYVGIDEAVFGPDVKDDDDVGIRYPQWCSVTVYRLVDGERHPFSSGKVFWKETYATGGRDTTRPNAMWKKRPYGQIEKCAEAMALRRAFPEIGAAPTREEMEGKIIEHDATPPTPQIEQPRSRSERAESAPSQPGPDVTTPSSQEGRAAGAASDAGKDDEKPMGAGQMRILRAKLKNAALTDIDLESKFGRRLGDGEAAQPSQGWLFSDFAKVQSWIAERSGAQGQ